MSKAFIKHSGEITAIEGQNSGDVCQFEIFVKIRLLTVHPVFQKINIPDMDEPVKSTKSTSNDGAKSTTLAAENGGSDEGGFPWPVAAGVTVVALAVLGAFLLFRKK